MIEIITKGTFYDEAWDGVSYEVQTITFRVLGELMNEYLFASHEAHYTEFESPALYRAYCKSQEEKLKAWKKKVKELLGWHEDTGEVTQVLSEIFTAVFIKAPSSLA